MSIKLIFKISVLVFALVLVVMGRKFFNSPGFQKNADEIFSVAANPFQWCSFERNQFTWTLPRLSLKYKNLPPTELAKKFCLIQAETIQGVDLKSVTWTPIAESVDSEGEQVILEQNIEKQLFRAGGLPFKSSSLSREINP
jgi:hypothetical protein